MGIFNRLKKALSGHSENDFPSDYVDDDGKFYVLTEPRNFTRSSVKGLFRSYKLADGFCTTWRHFIVARSWNGELRYRIDGFGRSIAVSPDMSKIVSSNDSQELAIFDSKTGKLVHSAISDEYLGDFLWTKNGHIISTDSVSIFVMDTELKLLKIIKRGNDCDFRFISGICADPNSESHIVVLDANEGKLFRIDFTTGEIVSSVKCIGGNELFYSEVHKTYWISSSYRVCTFDSNLNERMDLSYSIKKGVKHQGSEEDSYDLWTPLPVLSPNGSYFLVNDQSALLKLISALEDNKCFRTFNRDLLDFVYAILWEDDDHFVALLDDYRTVRLNIRGTNYLFDEKDSERAY